MTPIDPMDQLRDQFRVAAARDISRRQKRRRPSRKWLAIGGVAFATTAGAATAVELIAIGRNEPGNPESAALYGARTDQGRVAIQADDPGQELPWAVVTYEIAGQRCAMVGALRGSELGVVEAGKFRAFGSRSGAACNTGDAALFFDLRFLGDRAIYYGRARPGVATVEARFPGGHKIVRVGRTGAFLFVFDADTKVGDVDIVGKSADGSVAFPR